MAWTIERALASQYIDKVIVSTDSPKIARISRRYKAQVPFLRPKKLAGDHARMIDVLLHAMKFIEKREGSYDIVVLLQPTSPLRTTQDIHRGLDLLFKRRAKAAVSVSPVQHHPSLMNVLPKTGSMKNFFSHHVAVSNRQQGSRFYRINGALYVAQSDYLRRHRGFLGPQTFAYVMPTERSVDIDCLLDFRLAELIFSTSRKARIRNQIRRRYTG